MELQTKVDRTLFRKAWSKFENKQDLADKLAISRSTLYRIKGDATYNPRPFHTTYINKILAKIQ